MFWTGKGSSELPWLKAGQLIHLGGSAKPDQLAVDKPLSRVDSRGLPGKGNPNSHGARPVYLIITMIKWIRTRWLSIKKSRPRDTPFQASYHSVCNRGTSLIRNSAILGPRFGSRGVGGTRLAAGYTLVNLRDCQLKLQPCQLERLSTQVTPLSTSKTFNSRYTIVNLRYCSHTLHTVG